MSLLEIRGDRDQVLGRSSLKCLNLVPRLFSALPPVRWEKTLVWAGHVPPRIWEVFEQVYWGGDGKYNKHALCTNRIIKSWCTDDVRRQTSYSVYCQHTNLFIFRWEEYIALGRQLRLAGKECLIYRRMRRSDVQEACLQNVTLRVCAWIYIKGV